MTHRDGFPRLSASTRVARRCRESQAMRDAVRPLAESPWEAVVPVARANRQWPNGRGSESLDDVPQDPRLSSYPPVGPADRLRDRNGGFPRLSDGPWL